MRAPRALYVGVIATIPAHSTMSDLIDPQTSACCEELVRQIFILADVHYILSIPLSMIGLFGLIH